MSSDTNNAFLLRKNFREAADTGILLWRENFVYFLPLFAIPIWVSAFALRLFLPDNIQIYSWLIIWFFKPLFDRIIVHIISIKFFERDADFKRLCKGLWKTLFRGLIGDLSWRRFSPLRSSMMPMRVLEKNLKPGKLTSKRKMHLKKGGVDYGFFLTMWGMCIETVLLLGEFLFFAAMNELMFNGKIDMFDFANNEIYLFAAWCFNIMIIETIYICMGFSLYINSRITIEGWDLEIIFKTFAEKHKEKLKNAAAITLLAVFLFIPSFSHAEEDVPLDELQKVLESRDFESKKDSWGIRLKNDSDNKDIKEFDYSKLWAFFDKLQEFFARSLRVFLICIIVVLLVFLIIYFRKMNFIRIKNDNQPAVNIQDSKTEENPKILLDKALSHYKQGNLRLAWGYCTAAAIYSWQIYRKIIFPLNATESECANIINLKANNNTQDTAEKTVTAKEADIFNNLIKNWIYLAYAGQLPPEGSFDEAVNLCVLIRNENEQ